MRTLIIRPGAIGDTLLTLPVLHYLRTQLGATPITFIGNMATLPLLHALGVVEAYENYEDLRWSKLFLPPQRQRDPRFLASLHDFTLAIGWLHDNQGTIQQNLLAAGIEQIRIAPGRPAPGKQIHIVDYLAQSLGTIAGQAIPTPLPWQPPAAYAWQSEETTCAARTMIIHPGSGGKDKCWPIAAFAEVITQLWQRQIPVLLLTGPADLEQRRLLQTMLAPSPEGLLQSLEHKPLLTIANIMRSARGYLGNDSGLTHLAALLGLPTTVLFGPSDPLIWHPVGSRVQILQASEISEITPEHVLQQILNG